MSFNHRKTLFPRFIRASPFQTQKTTITRAVKPSFVNRVNICNARETGEGSVNDLFERALIMLLCSKMRFTFLKKVQESVLLCKAI